MKILKVFSLCLLAMSGYYFLYNFLLISDFVKNRKTISVSNNSIGNYLNSDSPQFESDSNISVPETKVEDPMTSIHSRLIQYFASLIIYEKRYPGAQVYVDYTINRLGLKLLKNVTPLRPEYGIVINDVTAFKYPIDIGKCRRERKANRTLFISILSAPNYNYKRDFLRKTWLRHLNDSHYHQGLLDVIGYGFILGKTSNQSLQSKIEEESKIHGDILQVEMVDSYHNLTRKVVSILNWVNSHCSYVDFVMKIDDDGYINVRNLATTLADLSPSELSVYGKQVGDILGVDRASDKWKQTYEQWPWQKLPPYAMGSGYLIAGSAIEPLLAAAQVIPFPFPNGAFEDEFITAFCAAIANVTFRTSPERFHVEVSGFWSPDPCFVRDHTTWMTQNSAQISSSHSTVEEFYRSSNSTCSQPPSQGLSEFGYIYQIRN